MNAGYEWPSQPAECDCPEANDAVLPAHAPTITLYVNGDRQFYGKPVTVNRRQIRNWESFLSLTTEKTGGSAAVREIATPDQGTRVCCLEQLQDRGSYVAIAKGDFKPIGYRSLFEEHLKKLDEQRQRRTDSTDVSGIRPVEHSPIKVPGKIATIPIHAKTILVYGNGNEFDGPHPIPLNYKVVNDYEMILRRVGDRVTSIIGAPLALYTTKGVKITRPSQLETGCVYVAVGKETSGFVHRNYDRAKLQLVRGKKRVPFQWAKISERRFETIFITPPRDQEKPHEPRQDNIGELLARHQYFHSAPRVQKDKITDVDGAEGRARKVGVKLNGEETRKQTEERIETQGEAGYQLGPMASVDVKHSGLQAVGAESSAGEAENSGVQRDSTGDVTETQRGHTAGEDDVTGARTGYVSGAETPAEVMHSGVQGDDAYRAEASGAQEGALGSSSSSESSDDEEESGSDSDSPDELLHTPANSPDTVAAGDTNEEPGGIYDWESTRDPSATPGRAKSSTEDPELPAETSSPDKTHESVTDLNPTSEQDPGNTSSSNRTQIKRNMSYIKRTANADERASQQAIVAVTGSDSDAAQQKFVRDSSPRTAVPVALRPSVGHEVQTSTSDLVARTNARKSQSSNIILASGTDASRS